MIRDYLRVINFLLLLLVIINGVASRLTFSANAVLVNFTGFLTVGVPTIRRINGPAYLLETLASLSEHTTASEKSEVSVIVFLADFDAEYNNESITAILKHHHDDVANGFITILQVSSSYYPQLSDLKRNFGDAPDRVQWRAKQVVDYSLLFMYSINISEYYIQLEDDVFSALQVVKSIRQYVAQQNWLHPKWAVLEFSELGFIGKLFRSSDLKHLAEFMMMFYVEQPVDWLFRYFKSAMNQQQTFLRKPTLFQHVGVKSSFDLSKDNILKDRLALCNIEFELLRTSKKKQITCFIRQMLKNEIVIFVQFN